MIESFSVTYALRCLGFGKPSAQSNARKTLRGAVIGIGLSLVPLILVLVISDGMIAGITSRLVDLNSGHIKLIKMHVASNENDGRHEKALKEELKMRYADNPYFKSAWVERDGSALIIGKNGRSGGSIRAIEKNFFAENQSAGKLLKVVSGSTVLEADNEVILGTKIANNLELSVGDTCRILTLKKNASGAAVPKFSSFKVKGIVSCGYQELDALWVFISLESGLKILHGSSSLTSVVVYTADNFAEKKFNPFVTDISKHLTDDFAVYTWKSLNSAHFGTYRTTKNLLVFIMFLILLVASMNISSALIMLVLERNKEIAILKATGASNGIIVRAFFIAGLLTSFLGLLVGFPVGILLAININPILSIIENVINGVMLFIVKLFNIQGGVSQFHILDPGYYLEHIPVNLHFNELLLVAVTALVLSALVSIIPSLRAGREKPYDIMRKV